MEHNTVFLNLPIEIHYKYVQYIDLRELGALIFACKQFYELFGTDLQLQKIVYENTETRVLHKKLRRPIKRLFMENRATYALKIDDIEFLKYTTPSLSYNNIAKYIQPFSSDPQVVMQTKAGKRIFADNLLPKIFDYDAAKCLEFLLEAFVADVPSNLNADGQIFSLLILIGIACFKPLKSNESPSILPYQKVLRVVLTHFHKRKELIFAKLVQDLNPNNPKTYPYMLIETLVQCGKVFPEFKIDLGMRIPSEFVDRNYRHTEFEIATLLETVIVAKDYSNTACERFRFLLRNGAPFDINAPYIPLLFLASPWSKLLETLEKHGASINTLLKPQKETILNALLRTTPSWNLFANARLFEYVLYKGAKLTKDEEERWLSYAPDTVEYKVAKSQQTNYNPLNNIAPSWAMKILSEVTDQGIRFEYLCPNQVVDNINFVRGTWEIKDGKVVVNATHESGRYGSKEDDPLATPRVFTYIVVATLNSIGLVIDDDTINEDEKIRKILVSDWSLGLMNNKESV
jgi:hypothetical protein